MIRKTLAYLHANGLKRTVKRALAKAFRITSSENKQPENTNVVSAAKEEHGTNLYTPEELSLLPYRKPLNVFLKGPPSDSVRLNLVTDSLDAQSLLAGVATSLILAVEFCNEHNIPLRVVTRTNNTDFSSLFLICDMNRLKIKVDVSFAFDNVFAQGEYSYSLPVTKNDIFLTTSWWTSYAVKRTFPGRKFFYLIQEVEPNFYQFDINHYLCSRTMEDPDIHYIVNSQNLYNYFKHQYPKITENGIYFNPAFSSKLFKPTKFREKEKWKLFFYHRPNHPRNFSFYGKELLDHCITHGIIDTSKWDVIFAGAAGDDPVFSNGYRGKNKGQMSWQNYSKFLTDVDLVLYLVYSPHLGYLPYDAACSGAVVVTNTYHNKTELDSCENVLLSDFDFDSMVQTIEKGMKIAQDVKARKQNYENSTIPKNWHDTLASTVEFMGKRMESCLGD